MKAVTKRPARRILIQHCNDWLTKRRSAIGKLNGLLQQLSLESFQLKPKDFDKDQLARVLRLLARRCPSLGAQPVKLD